MSSLTPDSLPEEHALSMAVRDLSEESPREVHSGLPHPSMPSSEQHEFTQTEYPSHIRPGESYEESPLQNISMSSMTVNSMEMPSQTSAEPQISSLTLNEPVLPLVEVRDPPEEKKKQSSDEHRLELFSLEPALSESMLSLTEEEKPSKGEKTVSSDERKLESVQDECSGMISDTAHNQMLKEEATVSKIKHGLLLAAKERERKKSMQLSNENTCEMGPYEDTSMLSYATAPESVLHEGNSMQTSMAPMPELVQHENMPSATEQNQESLSSGDGSMPSFISATESQPQEDMPSTTKQNQVSLSSKSDSRSSLVSGIESCPPGDYPYVYQTIKIPLLTFDEYKQRRKQWVESLLLELKGKYFDELHALLLQPPYNYSETIARKFAKDLLDPKSNFSCNPPTGSQFDERLNEYRTRWQRTVEEQLLMLRFPLHEVSVANERTLSLDEDDKSREQQNKEFVKMYGGNMRVCHKRIDSKNDLDYCIQSYLRKDCSSTCLATIIFNGHGTPNGLCVHSGADIPLGDVMKSVQLSMDAVESRIGTIQMPRAVDIVFAQCFGHMHEYTENPFALINVISLASNQRPFTYHNIVSPEQSVHYDLESYADRRRRLQQK